MSLQPPWSDFSSTYTRGSTFLPPIQVLDRWAQNRPVAFVPARGRSRVARLLQSALGQWPGVRLSVHMDWHRHRPLPAQRSATQRNLRPRAARPSFGRFFLGGSGPIRHTRAIGRGCAASCGRAKSAATRGARGRVGRFGLKRKLLGRKGVRVCGRVYPVFLTQPVCSTATAAPTTRTVLSVHRTWRVRSVRSDDISRSLGEN